MHVLYYIQLVQDPVRNWHRRLPYIWDICLIYNNIYVPYIITEICLCEIYMYIFGIGEILLDIWWHTCIYVARGGSLHYINICHILCSIYHSVRCIMLNLKWELRKNVHPTHNAVFFKVHDICTITLEYPIMGTKILKKTLHLLFFVMLMTNSNIYIF